MVEIKWQDPPAALTLHDSIVAALKNNPGRWALVGEDKSSSSAGAKWSKSGCETKLHRKTAADGKPQYDVYARWPEKVLPLPTGKAAAPTGKAAVEKAVATGTALKPPAPAIAKPDTIQPEPSPPVVSDPGLNNYLEKRRARVR